MKGCDDGLVGVVGEVQGARTIGVGLEGLNTVVNYRVGVQMLIFISSLLYSKGQSPRCGCFRIASAK